MEVYTISGPDVELLGPPTAEQTACAKRAAPLFVAGAGAQFLGAPITLFGTYKLFKKSPAAGVTGLIAGVALFLAGRRLVKTSATMYEGCMR